MEKPYVENSYGTGLDEEVNVTIESVLATMQMQILNILFFSLTKSLAYETLRKSGRLLESNPAMFQLAVQVETAEYILFELMSFPRDSDSIKLYSDRIDKVILNKAVNVLVDKLTPALITLT